jgi:rubrerythrin
MSKSAVTLIEEVLLNEKKVHENIEAYTKTLEATGLRKLLVSIINQEREHENQLKELLKKGFDREAFADDKINSIELCSFNEITADVTDLTPSTLLQQLIKYYKDTEMIYKQLTAAALDPEIRLVIMKLAEGKIKLGQWVKDRYDLEVLSE